MKRFAVLMTCSLMLAGSGCCGWHNPYCGGYGAGYAPSYGGSCPGGSCAPGYPSGAYYGGGATAYAPYGYQTTAAPYGSPATASLNYLPAY